MRKYRCTVCDYVYDPERGDAARGVPPGTMFQDLPTGWTCPDCGVGREFFQPVP